MTHLVATTTLNPVTTIAPVARQQIFDKLSQMEEEAQQASWTMSPFFGALVIGATGKIESTLIEDDLEKPADAFVMFVCRRMNDELETTKELLERIQEQSQGQFYALVFGCEAWLKTWPGDRMVRLLQAVDIHGRVYQISRVQEREHADIELLDEHANDRLTEHAMVQALLRGVRALSVWFDDDGAALARLDQRLQDWQP